MRTRQTANVDHLLLRALNQDRGSVPEDWKKDISKVDETVLSLALMALQTARNREVKSMHRHVADLPGLPKPATRGDGYVEVRNVSDDPGAVAKHMRLTVGERPVICETLADDIALGYSLRRLRRDHGHALTPGRSQAPFQGGDVQRLRQLGYGVMGHRPATDALMQPGVYAVATGYARQIGRIREDDRLAVGLLGAYGQAYIDTGQSMTLAPLANRVGVARAKALDDVWKKYAWVSQESVRRSEVPGVHQDIGKFIFERLGVQMGEVLERPYYQPASLAR